MKQIGYLVLLLLALLLLVMTTGAQDEAPAESPQDNACYAGGSWEGTCDWPTDAEDEWAWTCGWYVARVESGVLPASAAPVSCKLVPVETCYTTGTGFGDFKLIAPVNTLNNVDFYPTGDGSCGGAGVAGGTLVSAADSTAATTLCSSLVDPAYFAVSLGASGLGYINVPADWYGCTPV